MAQTTYKVIQQVEGTDKVATLAAQLALAQQRLQHFYETEKAAVAAGAQWSSQMQDAATKVAQFQNSLANAQRELRSTQINSAQLGAQIGYLADDIKQFEYGASAGFRAVGNNLQGLLASIPKLAPYAGWIAAAGSAAALLYDNWDKISALFGQGHTKTEAEQMAELAKNTKRTADEEERYQKLRKERKNIDEQHGETSVQSEQGGRINQAIRDAPVKKMEDAVKVLYDKELKGAIDPKVKKARDDAQKDLESARKLGVNPDQLKAFQKGADDAQKEYEKHYNEQVQKKLGSFSQLDENGTPAKFNDFMDRLERRKDLQPGSQQMDKLREAQKTKDDIQDEKDEEEARKREEAWNNKRVTANEEAERESAKTSWVGKKNKDMNAYEQAAAAEHEKKMLEDLANENPRLKEIEDREKKEKEDKKAEDEKQKKFAEEGKKNQAAKAQGRIWANEDQIGMIDKRMDMIREQGSTKSEITEGGASFAAKVQGGVSNENVQKDQLKVLEAMKDQLQKVNENIQRSQQMNARLT